MTWRVRSASVAESGQGSLGVPLPSGTSDRIGRKGWGRWSVAVPIALIRGYQVVLSPLLGANCRFAPSCSEYARQALAKYGLWRGTRLALSRILRCHPWNPGGWDPVP